MVAAAERSRLPRAPLTDDFDKVMESSCPFHPKGKHSAKDCFALKAYVERNSKTPVRDQDGPNRNTRPATGRPSVPRPRAPAQHDIRGVGCIRVQAEAKANRSGDQCSYSGNPQISQMIGGTNHLRPSRSSGPHSSPRPLPPRAGSDHPNGQT